MVAELVDANAGNPESDILRRRPDQPSDKGMQVRILPMARTRRRTLYGQGKNRRN